MSADNKSVGGIPVTFYAKPKGWWVFAHPQDIHCVLYHLISLVAYGLSFWIYLNFERFGITTIWEKGAFIAASAIMLGWISGIEVGVNFHNHCHRPIFKHKFLNRWFGRLWTFSGGWPALFWRHAHVTVHHNNLLHDCDWTLPKKKADGSFESMFIYCALHWPFRYAYHLYKDIQNGGGLLRPKSKAYKELVIFLVLWSIPFFIDPVMALWLWVLPQWIGNAVVMAGGMYAQHAGCVQKTDDHPVNHSNTYLSKFFNMSMFEIGYHIEHHDYPYVHWTELPKLHEYLKEQLKAGNARVLPYGFYHAGEKLSALWGAETAKNEFLYKDSVYAPPVEFAPQPQTPEDPDEPFGMETVKPSATA
jgi:fatty acid desaturase